MYGLYGRNGQFSINFVDWVDWNDPYGWGGQKPVKLLISCHVAIPRSGKLSFLACDEYVTINEGERVIPEEILL